MRCCDCEFREVCPDMEPDDVTDGNMGENIMNRLAAYEGTGLTPEEVAELAQAKADGRCVVLPCRVGGTVWDEFGMAWEITQVEHHMNGRIWFRCGHNGTDDYTAFSDEYIGDDFFLTEPEGKAAKARWNKKVAAIHAEVTRA